MRTAEQSWDGIPVIETGEDYVESLRGMDVDGKIDLAEALAGIETNDAAK